MEIVISAVVVAIGLFLSLIWMWAIIDIVKGNFKKENDKLVWLILVVAIPAIGTLMYLAYGKHQKLEITDEFV